MTYPPLFEPEDYQEHLPSRMSQEYGEVMEITAELESAVICDPVGGIHLDGPLSYAAFCEIPRADRESLPPLSAPWALDFLIPLRAANASGVTMPNVDDRLLWHGNVWFWMCTDNLTPWEGMHAAPVRGPTCHREMIRHSNDRRVNISAGAYKPVNHSYPARWPEGGVLRWLAIGDVDEVRRLLTTHVHALGRRHSKILGRRGIGHLGDAPVGVGVGAQA